MSNKKEPDSIKKSTYLFIIGVIFYALFNQFVWEKYVYTPTASDALEIDDQPATIGEIDKKASSLYLPQKIRFNCLRLWINF